MPTSTAPRAHRRLTPDELTGATTSSAEPIAANPRVSGHWERARGSGTDVSVKWFRGSVGSATGIPSLVLAASCSRFCHWASVLASSAAPNHIEVGQLLALDHVFGAVDSKGRIGLRKITGPDNDHGLEQPAGLLGEGHTTEEIVNPLIHAERRVLLDHPGRANARLVEPCRMLLRMANLVWRHFGVHVF